MTLGALRRSISNALGVCARRTASERSRRRKASRGLGATRTATTRSALRDAFSTNSRIREARSAGAAGAGAATGARSGTLDTARASMALPLQRICGASTDSASTSN
eukprot:1681055-Pleurochrysis_carterae.AAC.1